MTDRSPADLSASELSAAYAAGTLSPPEVLASCLARVEERNPGLNAIVTLDAAGARIAAEASAARWRSGKPLGPLDGVPITLKDSLLTQGLRSTRGSVIVDHVPDHDEIPVARLRAAGLVFVGKTNVPEFTSQGYTHNLLFGTTGNPFDPALTPGGSSGGAVAAVATGMAPLALGTDAGGSIRRPASHTGLFGLKPTQGRIARGDGFPVIMPGLEVVGPIARSIDDIDLMMEALAGADPRDPESLHWPAWRSAPTREGVLKILWIKDFAGSPVDAEIAASVAAACDDLGRLGHRVEAGPAPFSVESLARIWSIMPQSGLAWLMRPHADRLDDLTPSIRAMVEAGAEVSGADVVEALNLIAALKRDLGDAFSRHDVILTPSAAALPWAADRTHPETIDGRPVGPRGHAVFTSFVNASGCPGLAVPCTPSRAGLPIGFQIVAPPGRDELLIDLAKGYVAATSSCSWGNPPVA